MTPGLILSLSRWTRGLAVAGAILAVGCQTPPQRQVALDPADARPRALIAGLEQFAAERSSLTGALHFSLDAPDLVFHRPQRLALRRPSELRVEVLGLFGQIAAILVTDGVSFQSFDARRGSFETGAVRADLLWRVARLALSPEEVVDLLLGTPRPSADTLLAGAYTLASAHAELRDGIRVLFRDREGRLRERFGFDTRGRLIEFVRFALNGDVTLQARFSDYRDVSGSAFAFEIHLVFPTVKARATLQFDHATLDPELDDALFALGVPKGNGLR